MQVEVDFLSFRTAAPPPPELWGVSSAVGRGARTHILVLLPGTGALSVLRSSVMAMGFFIAVLKC